MLGVELAPHAVAVGVPRQALHQALQQLGVGGNGKIFTCKGKNRIAQSSIFNLNEGYDLRKATQSQ